MGIPTVWVAMYSETLPGRTLIFLCPVPGQRDNEIMVCVPGGKHWKRARCARCPRCAGDTTYFLVSALWLDQKVCLLFLLVSGDIPPPMLPSVPKLPRFTVPACFCFFPPVLPLSLFSHRTDDCSPRKSQPKPISHHPLTRASARLTRKESPRTLFRLACSH